MNALAYRLLLAVLASLFAAPLLAAAGSLRGTVRVSAQIQSTARSSWIVSAQGPVPVRRDTGANPLGMPLITVSFPTAGTPELQPVTSWNRGARIFTINF